jgi:energy-converting hydrogenase Eha subunit F
MTRPRMAAGDPLSPYRTGGTAMTIIGNQPGRIKASRGEMEGVRYERQALSPR